MHVIHVWSFSSHCHLQVYDLKQQVEHKAAFLRERMLLPGRPPVLLLGHSIGVP
jgi:hypothetical protein